MQNIYYEDIADLIDEIEGKASASGLHGMVCGELAAGIEPPDDTWLKACLRYLDSSAQLSGNARRELLTMREASLALLQDEELAFHLLLPDEDSELLARIAELGGWCQGFLHGFAVAEKVSGRSLSGSEEVQEILSDFAAVAEIDSEDDDEEDDAEHDFMQLTEYVRMATLTLYALCSVELSKKPEAPATLH